MSSAGPHRCDFWTPFLLLICQDRLMKTIICQDRLGTNAMKMAEKRTEFSRKCRSSRWSHRISPSARRKVGASRPSCPQITPSPATFIRSARLSTRRTRGADTAFLMSILNVKTNDLPRQARDEHTKS